MKAIAYTQTGPAAEVLKLVDLPTPEPGPGEVRVRLSWSGGRGAQCVVRSGDPARVDEHLGVSSSGELVDAAPPPGLACYLVGPR